MDETQELSYAPEVATGWAVWVWQRLARSRVGRKLIHSIIRNALGGMR